MENNNMNKSIVNIAEVNGNENKLVNNRNKQNNIDKNKEINNTTKVIKTTKNKKSKIPFEEKFKPEYKLSAHEGIESLQLSQTTPRTPREAMDNLYKQGIKNIEKVTMFVKGYLPNSNQSMVVVTNVNGVNLLANHCNIKVKNNPDIVNYFGKLIQCNIELYPYSDCDGKYSFNITEVLEVEDKHWYEGVTFNLNLEKIPYMDNKELNSKLNNLLKSSESYKLKVLNEVINLLDHASQALYGNGNLLTNYVLDVLFMSTNVDKSSLTDNEFLNKYYYDIIMNLVNAVVIVFNAQDKRYFVVSNVLFLSIATYLNSPSVNDGIITNEFISACEYLNVSLKHAKYFYMINRYLFGIEYSTPEFRTNFINKLRENVLSFCSDI